VYQQALERFQKHVESDHWWTKRTARDLATPCRSEDRTPKAELVESNYDSSGVAATD
jgi:hypothetical protein